MNDIRPHRPKSSVPPRPDEPSPAVPPREDTLEVTPTETPFGSGPEKKKYKKILRVAALALLAATVLVIGTTYAWYQTQLAPVSGDEHAKHVRLTIEEGASPGAIAAELEATNVIRSELAFRIYTKLTRTENSLQAGVYNLSPARSTPEIVEVLTSGKVDTVTITFLPGATVAEHKKVLLEAGYKEAVIDTALQKQYQHPLFAGKPRTADLEGYVYGETYQFPASATVEDILVRTFDEFYAVVKAEKLVDAYKKRGLSLYKGITLASIVQREVPTAVDQAKVAGVFYNRIDEGMNLGSDVTYQYIADKTGVPRDPGLDSPYNTRIHTGLPPGPIASPGESALLAVAHPAKSDYLFFLSGDNDRTYFGRTEAEHQQNIEKHCQKKCQIL